MWKRNVRTRNVLKILLCNDLDVDLWPWPYHGTRTHMSLMHTPIIWPMTLIFFCTFMTQVRSFHIKVKVKGQCQGHYLAKLLKPFRFSQNDFTFLCAIWLLSQVVGSMSMMKEMTCVKEQLIQYVKWSDVLIIKILWWYYFSQGAKLKKVHY